MQLLVKILITLCWLYCSFLLLRIVWTKEIDLQYPFRLLKGKVEKSIPTITSGISISPEKIVLNTNQWKGISSFNIHNPTTETLYNIYLKLIIETAGIKSEDMEITPANESDFIKGQLDNYSVNFDIVKVIGADSKSKEAIILIIYSLLPNESKQFRINIKDSLNSTVEKTTIFVIPIKYSKEPIQVVSQGKNKVAFPFDLTERFTIKGMSAFIRKR